MGDLFSQNMVSVFFVYGLSWFTMGLALLWAGKKGLGLKMANSLPWLAAFGISHAFVEWGDMLKLTPESSSALGTSEFLPPAKAVLLGVSTAFLVQFGAHLLASTHPRLRWLLALPPVLFITWVAVSILLPQLLRASAWRAPTTGHCLQCHLAAVGGATMVSTAAPLGWIPTAEVSARYLLYLPGLVLSAIAFWQQAPAFRRVGLAKAARDTRLVAAVFAFNAFFAGLVVAPGPYFPANVLNYHSYIEVFPVPPQVFRTIAALLSAVFIVRMTRVFEQEQQRQLEIARHERQRAQQLYLEEVESSREEMARLNAQLEERVSDRTRELATLLESAKVMAGTLELNALLPTVMEESASLAGTAEASILFLYDEGSARLVGRSSFGCYEQPIAELQLELEETVAGEAFRERRIVVCHDEEEAAAGMRKLRPESRRLLESARSGLSQPRNLVCVPVQAKGRSIGCLLLANVRSVGSLSLELLEGLADQMGLAVDNARLFEETKQLASTDALTGLWNRRTIEHRLQLEISRHRRQGRELSILVVDIDRLKLFNDTYGHTVGDQVIITVATALQAACREIDEVGRYGGDEFVIILPDTGKDGIRALTPRILQNLQIRPLEARGETVPIGVSIGGATYPTDALDVDGLLTKADAAMYRAKLEGGSDFYAPTLVSDGSSVTFEALQGLLATVDAKDRYTLKHSQEVARYAVHLARGMGMTKEEQESLRLAGYLHDIGKIGVPIDILAKPGRLSPDEFEVIKGHSRLGYAILQQLPLTEAIMGTVLDAVLHCHERWDGSGYPDGLKGEQIPKLARALAVADAYSSMTTDRPYRRGLSREAALEQIRKSAGTHLDPEMALCFASLPAPDEPDSDAILGSPLTSTS